MLACGGQVTDKIDIINAVVADVPQANLAQLIRTVGVLGVMPDRSVKMVGELSARRRVVLMTRRLSTRRSSALIKFGLTGNLGQDVTVATLDTGIDPTFLSLRVAPGVWQDRYLAYYDAIADKTV